MTNDDSTTTPEPAAEPPPGPPTEGQVEEAVKAAAAPAIEPAAEPRATYPIRLEVARPERQRRLTNFPLFVGTLIRLVLLTPHFFMLYTLYSAAQIAAWLLTPFAILFTGRYPRGLFKLNVGILRWYANVMAYYLHLFDAYPPLDLDQRADRELLFAVEYPARSSRLLNFPILGLLIRLVILIPHLIILTALWFLVGVVVFVGQLVILFTRSFPAGLHQLVVASLRWSFRVLGYLFGFTDKYPPFSFS